MGERLSRATDVGTQHGVEAGRLESFAEVHAHREAVVYDENPWPHICLPEAAPLASAPSAGAIFSKGRTCSAAPRRIASLGMPNTTDVASSWAIVLPPARRMARRPSAPSLPIPVRRQAAQSAPSSCAREAKRTSTDGRH